MFSFYVKLLWWYYEAHEGTFAKMVVKILNIKILFFSYFIG